MPGRSVIRFFITSTQQAGYSQGQVEELASWLDCSPVFVRPLPVDQPGLVLCNGPPMLHAPDHKPQPWHPGMAHRRLKLPHDGLLRAIDAVPGESVLDCTLGMGHDTLILLNAGLSVLAADRCAALLFYTLDGLTRYAPGLSRRLRVCRADYRALLRRLPHASVDYVYMDPMFPRGYNRRSATWSFMRAVTPGGERINSEILQSALLVARKRVLLKLAPNEPPPHIAGFPEPREAGSNRVKFAVWDKP